MRRTLVALAIMAVGVAAEAGDGRRAGRGADTDLFVAVPLETDTGVVFPFGGSHHAVPGVVTINQKAPYFCRAHARGFRDRPAFVEHLGVQHGLTDRDIPGLVVVGRGQVRYVGD
jgi:hypothetical protein